MFALIASLFLLQGPETAVSPPVPPPPPVAAVRPAPPVPPAPAAPPRAATPRPDPDADLLRGEWPAQPSGKRVTLDSKETIDDAVAEIEVDVRAELAQ